MYRHFCQLSPVLLLYSFEVVTDVYVDGHIVLQILPYNPWRYFAFEPLQGDVLLQSRLEIRDYARLSDFYAVKVDDGEARILEKRISQLFKPIFVRNVLIFRKIQAGNTFVFRQPLCEIDKASVGKEVFAYIKDFQPAVVFEEAAEYAQALVIDLVEAEAQLLQRPVHPQSHHEV